MSARQPYARMAFRVANAAAAAAVAVAATNVAGHDIFSASKAEPAPAPSVGIIGTGWGLKVQVPQFRKAGMHVAAIFSRSQARAAEIATANGIDKAYSSVAELCADPAVSLVSVVCPTYERCGYAITALEAGKHVLADKPMALSAAEAEQMLAAARAAPDQLALLDFELRAVPAVQHIKQLLASGELGAPLHFSFRCLGNFGFLADGATYSHWVTREGGGGVFSAVGTHFVDLTRYLTGREVVAVSAMQHPLVDSMPDPKTGTPTP
eukprot:5744155-Pleurochrysis_carterae.AAC.4